MRIFKLIGALVVVLAFSVVAVATSASAKETLWKWLPGSVGETMKGKSGEGVLSPGAELGFWHESPSQAGVGGGGGGGQGEDVLHTWASYTSKAESTSVFNRRELVRKKTSSPDSEASRKADSSGSRRRR